ncbi:MAG: filamentous hemagglutinin N-terminal domain-containing protein, partial [Limnobacter sp.]|nr:filamentous hemagglutinin N-terminal domain-containing protein [Limnobacter sp.]
MISPTEKIRSAFKLSSVYSSLLLAFGGSAVMAQTVPPAVVLPTGGDLPSVNKNSQKKDVDIQELTDELRINQLAPVLELDWPQLNIGQGQTLRFVAASRGTGNEILTNEEALEFNPSQMLTINRVENGSSQLLGKLVSTGKVFLINPRGIVFGEQFEANVGALVASTLPLNSIDDNEQFLFEVVDDDDVVSSAAVLRAQGRFNTGDVVLIAPDLAAAGELTSQPGTRFQFIQAEKAQVDLGDNAIKANAEGQVQRLKVNVLNDGAAQIVLELQRVGSQSLTALNTAGEPVATGIVFNVDGGVSIVSGLLEDQLAKVSVDKGDLPGSGQLDTDIDFNGSVSIDFQEGRSLVANASDIEMAVTKGLHVQSLQATANNRITQGEFAVRVDGQSQFVANQTTLIQEQNNFSGQVIAQGIGPDSSLSIHDADDLNVRVNGVDQSGVHAEQGQAQVSMSEAGRVTIQAGSVVLGEAVSRSQIEGDLTVLPTSSITQAGAIDVRGDSDLQADTIALTNSANLFSGEVRVRSSVPDSQVTLHHDGDLNLNVSGVDQVSVQGENGRSHIGFSDLGSLSVVSQSVRLGEAGDESTLTGHLNVDAQQGVDQHGRVSVGGLTTLNANQINLLLPDNDFQNGVQAQAKGTNSLLQLTDSNDLAVSTTGFNQVLLNGRTVHLGFDGAALQAGRLEVQAQQSISQSGTVNVSGPAQFTSNQINLTHSQNDFDARVQVTGAG